MYIFTRIRLNTRPLDVLLIFVFKFQLVQLAGCVRTDCTVVVAYNPFVLAIQNIPHRVDLFQHRYSFRR